MESSRRSVVLGRLGKESLGSCEPAGPRNNNRVFLARVYLPRARARARVQVRVMRMYWYRSMRTVRDVGVREVRGTGAGAIEHECVWQVRVQ